MIVYDLMHNGSLYDHLLGSKLKRLRRAQEVIEENMPEPKLPEVMEQYVLLAVLSCHPHLQARPNIYGANSEALKNQCGSSFWSTDCLSSNKLLIVTN
ncbi:putative LRR receptor-like serine/threonine-protein kinase RKF3 [Camellia lanceoleosa]|uniref:LRR receptor-like serine/threonine-protein kinase RKF3 n=1 Tax=Camellia lanceoleosa TaxID=1840588 RepID=A0ACC0IID5_9ERIC|nr:putative LRR receptor-like serine/threonine-protein kinase RKF3 [Camellia lanceoleosa]